MCDQSVCADLPILVSANPDLIARTSWAGIGPGKRPVVQDSFALRFEAIKLHDKVSGRLGAGAVALDDLVLRL